MILDSPEIQRLIADIEATRWTGRPGYPIRALLGVALAKSLYAIPTWSKTIGLVHEHEALQRVLGAVPSVYAAYRFAVKLHAHRHLLERCTGQVIERLRTKRPGLGENIAIDASDLPAWSSVQTYTMTGGKPREAGDYSDREASWGYRTPVATRKSQWFYGYKVHIAACSLTGLPLAWEIRTASEKEMGVALDLLDAAIRRRLPIKTVAMDKGYDSGAIYEGCLVRGTLPVIPAKKLKGDAKGVRRSRFLPRDTPRWKALYRARTAIEREFSQLKTEWSLLPLRVRGLARVQLHVDVTILAKLCCAAAGAVRC